MPALWLRAVRVTCTVRVAVQTPSSSRLSSAHPLQAHTHFSATAQRQILSSLPLCACTPVANPPRIFPAHHGGQPGQVPDGDPAGECPALSLASGGYAILVDMHGASWRLCGDNGETVTSACHAHDCVARPRLLEMYMHKCVHEEDSINLQGWTSPYPCTSPVTRRRVALIHRQHGHSGVAFCIRDLPHLARRVKQGLLLRAQLRPFK